jgi:hypothetical protein
MFGRKKKVDTSSIEVCEVRFTLAPFVGRREAMRVLKAVIGPKGEYFRNYNGVQKETPSKALFQDQLETLGSTNRCCRYVAHVTADRAKILDKKFRKSKLVVGMDVDEPRLPPSLIKAARKELKKDQEDIVSNVDHCPACKQELQVYWDDSWDGRETTLRCRNCDEAQAVMTRDDWLGRAVEIAKKQAA